MKVAISGANGFIGRSLVRRLGQDGCEIVALTREPFTDGGGRPCAWIRYSLEGGLSARLPDDCDTILHCAYGMSPRGRGDIERNVAAAKALQAAAQGRRLVF